MANYDRDLEREEIPGQKEIPIKKIELYWAIKIREIVTENEEPMVAIQKILELCELEEFELGKRFETLGIVKTATIKDLIQ